ncbi:hypothetical protein DY000_02047470 [Brassica cretica]|uniref:Uncharacterized protein n=1 Tax=Brassica cretica TaxID=69181 RepID=A0ABQ7FA86_BRACR|nr:hypothetical protein DY000_02047470 [Brassica cretica]
MHLVDGTVVAIKEIAMEIAMSYKWDNNEKHLRPQMALFYLRTHGVLARIIKVEIVLELEEIDTHKFPFRLILFQDLRDFAYEHTSLGSSRTVETENSEACDRKDLLIEATTLI